MLIAIKSLFLLHVTCQSPIVRENWSLSFRCYNLIPGRMPPKMYFLFYLRTQILLIDSYVLNSTSAAFQSIWLKFGQSDAIYLFYKTVNINLSANFNTPFHFKATAFFPQGVLTNCLPQLQFLIKEKQTHLSKIWDTGRVFTSGFSGRSASDKRKSRENSCFFNPLKVKRVGKLQWNSH